MIILEKLVGRRVVERTWGHGRSTWLIGARQGQWGQGRLRSGEPCGMRSNQGRVEWGRGTSLTGWDRGNG